jgi:hypothetical protein
MMKIFKTPDSEGSGGMLMSLGLLPPGAVVGGLRGPFPFGRPALRDNRIAIERDQALLHERLLA